MYIHCSETPVRSSLHSLMHFYILVRGSFLAKARSACSLLPFNDSHDTKHETRHPGNPRDCADSRTGTGYIADLKIQR